MKLFGYIFSTNEIEDILSIDDVVLNDGMLHS